MKKYLSAICVIASTSLAQTGNGNVLANIRTLPIEPDAVVVVHLAAGYTTSVKLPEEVSSVVVGNPVAFKAEHSEAEARLVFFKPIIPEQSETNALITTKSGQEISLHLINGGGKLRTNTPVDFLIEYKFPQPIATIADNHSFLIPESRSIALTSLPRSLAQVREIDPIADLLQKQKESPSPDWKGKGLLVAIGSSTAHDDEMVLGFSVLNNTLKTMEILSPQVELTGISRGKKRITAEPISISEYRISARRLAPRERADGVVVFSRPSFKESSEELRLRLADAERVDNPVLVAIPFVPEGGR